MTEPSDRRDRDTGKRRLLATPAALPDHLDSGLGSRAAGPGLPERVSRARESQPNKISRIMVTVFE